VEKGTNKRRHLGTCLVHNRWKQDAVGRVHWDAPLPAVAVVAEARAAVDIQAAEFLGVDELRRMFGGHENVVPLEEEGRLRFRG
jgi:hypothetical protein